MSHWSWTSNLEHLADENGNEAKIVQQNFIESVNYLFLFGFDVNFGNVDCEHGQNTHDKCQINIADGWCVWH